MPGDHQKAYKPRTILDILIYGFASSRLNSICQRYIKWCLAKCSWYLIFKFFMWRPWNLTVLIHIRDLWQNIQCNVMNYKRWSIYLLELIFIFYTTRNSRRFAPFFLALEGASRSSSKLVVNMFSLCTS